MRILCWCALAGLTFPSAVFSQPGEDEVQKLKAEIVKLREENAQLKKEVDRLQGPQAKFEQVLWLQTKGDKKGTLYLVIPVTGGGLRKQLEALGPYAAAAVKEAAKAPISLCRVCAQIAVGGFAYSGTHVGSGGGFFCEESPAHRSSAAGKARGDVPDPCLDTLA